MEKYKDRNGKWMYKRIFKLYMLNYNKRVIECHRRGITSIPSYPELKQLYCNDNQLTTLSSYPKLYRLVCNNNQLITLPNLPNLRFLYCKGNRLSILPKFPKLQYCIADDNLCELSGNKDIALDNFKKIRGDRYDENDIHDNLKRMMGMHSVDSESDSESDSDSEPDSEPESDSEN